MSPAASLGIILQDGFHIWPFLSRSGFCLLSLTTIRPLPPLLQIYTQDPDCFSAWISVTEFSPLFIQQSHLINLNQFANVFIYSVKQQDARDKDMDDWKFEITEDAGMLGVPRIINNGANLYSKSKEQPQSDDPKDIREWIEQAKDMYQWPMTRADIKKTVFGEIGGQKNTAKQHADLNVALNMHYLEESTLKSGNGSYMLQIPEDLPF